MLATSPCLAEKLGGDFVLSGEGNKEVHLSDFNGKPSVLLFGFTTCPDSCPMSLGALSSLLKRHKLQEEVNIVFISVDWKRDTGDKVQKYASIFGKNIIGLAGTETQINAATEGFKSYFRFVEMKDTALKYSVDHSTALYVRDKNGEIVGVLRGEDRQSDALLKTLRGLK